MFLDAQAWRRTANAMALLARVTAEEVPETAAAVRLGGLEVTDAVQELGLLGCDFLLILLDCYVQMECWKLAKPRTAGKPAPALQSSKPRTGLCYCAQHQ